jgi:hypothetical protein
VNEDIVSLLMRGRIQIYCIREFLVHRIFLVGFMMTTNIASKIGDFHRHLPADRENANLFPSIFSVEGDEISFASCCDGRTTSANNRCPMNRCGEWTAYSLSI